MISDKFTINQISRHYQVSERTVRRWIKSGKLSVLHIGRLCRIDAADLQRFEADYLRTERPVFTPEEKKKKQGSVSRRETPSNQSLKEAVGRSSRNCGFVRSRPEPSAADPVHFSRKPEQPR